MKLAYVFAGQGRRPSRRQIDMVGVTSPQLLHQAAVVAGLSTSDELTARGGIALDRTSVLQPVVIAIGVAIASRLPPPHVVVGHSLGELAAAAAAGLVTGAEAVRLAGIRGEAMHDACERHRGGLVAIDRSRLDRALEVVPAAYQALDNAPDEVVLGGDEASVLELVRRFGGRRLTVAGAFHGPTMTAAARRFGRALAAVATRPLRCPMVTCLDARETIDATALAHKLVAAMTKPARFREALQRLHADGVEHFVVVGPGATLRRMIRTTLPRSVRVFTTESESDLALAMEAA